MSTASSSTWNWPSLPRTCSCCSPISGYPPLVVIPGHERPAFTDEEVEVGALVRLFHMVEVKAPVAARQRRLGLLPFRLAFLQFLVGNEQLELSLRHVELDH